MPKRRKRDQEPSSHERWLVSYADFITLLFAFFVVMYSISSLNEGKYRVLSDTLNAAFREPSRSVDPIQVGELSRSSGILVGEALGLPTADGVDGDEAGPANDTPDVPEQEFLRGYRNRVDEEKRLGYIAASIESVLAPLVDRELVEVRHNRYWVEVDMKSKLLFGSGSSFLSREAHKALSDISRILKPIPNPIHVEGYTDNVPIRTAVFPSNWELSAARAASVVHLFARLGVDPRRLAAVGFGEFRPVVSNGSEAGRQRNRRVSLIILANDLPQGQSSHLAGRRAGLAVPSDRKP